MHDISLFCPSMNWVLESVVSDGGIRVGVSRLERVVIGSQVSGSKQRRNRERILGKSKGKV